MIVIYGDNVSKPSDKVFTSVVFPVWIERQKQNQVLKINGEWLRVSELMETTFKFIARVDKKLAKQMLRRYKLIWEYMQFRKSCDLDNMDERLITLSRGTTTWELLELGLIEKIIGNEIEVNFTIHHESPAMINCGLLSYSPEVRFGWSDGKKITPMTTFEGQLATIEITK